MNILLTGAEALTWSLSFDLQKIQGHSRKAEFNS
jgi:hypothetical protein